MNRYVIALVLATLATSVNAALVTIQFTGVVDGSRIIEGPDEGLPMPGAPASGSLIQGWYTYETTTPDSAVGCSTCDSHGTYDAIINAAWSIGNLEYQLGANSAIAIENDTSGSQYNRDRYVFGATQPAGPAIGEYDELMLFQFSIFDFEGGPDPDLFSDDSLPSGAPDMSLATDAFGLGPEGLFPIIMQYHHESLSIRAQILGHLTSIETVSLPEPGTLALFAIGLTGIVWLRRRKIA